MANADAVSNKDIQEQVKKGVQDYRQSLFPDKDLETKKKVVEKLQKAYINASPEGRKNILNLLGASQTIIDNSLTATQKMDVLHDSNALLKNM